MDISVAVSTSGGLITPIVFNADTKVYIVYSSGVVAVYVAIVPLKGKN